MNHVELEAARRVLLLSTAEAARLIGGVSTRTWQNWEAGKYNIPEDVKIKIYGLLTTRTKVKEALSETKSAYFPQNYSDYRIVNSEGTELEFIAQRSALADLFADQKISLA